ncbi:hypothetical protein ACP70R_025018 [Stipagrostis hirtigluma subsp. patula]
MDGGVCRSKQEDLNRTVSKAPTCNPKLLLVLRLFNLVMSWEGSEMMKRVKIDIPDPYFCTIHGDQLKDEIFGDKRMSTATVSAMKIPEEFGKKFSGHISEVIELEAPNGKKCKVQVTRGLNKLVLESGWETFCTAHDLQLGDFLVFRYSGNSRFMVLIFLSNGCQKVSSCVVRNSGLTAREKSDNTVKIPSSSLPPFNRFGSAQRYQHRCLKRKTEIVTSTDSSSHNSEDVPSPEDIQDPENSTECRYVLSRNCKLTTEQKAQVAALEQGLKPAIPLYVIAVKKVNRNSSLNIRMEYAVKYLPREDGTITLCGPSSHEYGDVDFKIRSDGRNAVSGWPGFMRTTGLKEGDVCIFEVSKTKTGVTITVHPLPRKYPASNQLIRKACW